MIPALVSAVAMIPVALLLAPAQRGTTIDWYGAPLLAAWLGLLLLAISQFGRDGWLYPLAGSAVLAPIWRRAQRRAAQTRVPRPVSVSASLSGARTDTA